MPFTAVVYNIYFNQFYVFFSFFLHLVQSHWTANMIHYYAPLRIERNTTGTTNTTFYLYIQRKPMKNAILMYAYSPVVVGVVQLYKQIYTYIPMRLACRIRNKWQPSRNFTQNTNFIFILRLRYGKIVLFEPTILSIKWTCLKWRPDSRYSLTLFSYG